ncbi:nuclear control of ATPase [Pseudogymnoascus verrucosus]|uniref:Nuclear control of ATPase n=1 Tax=Pseudogymnoascus verrucosus TaxID=342668 RepID=A0A1B8GAU3_9PEZI|nr:nuclear control of ATPase [Pseudogymnoascus verrucosus]OBT92897.1 nuclear control of ATPase [Pseudogymnoascus verrucosus]
MSIVADQVRRVDSQLDRLQLAHLKSATSSPILTYRRLSTTSEAVEQISTSPQIEELQVLIKALSATSSSRALLTAWRISTLLEQAGLSEGEVNALGETKSPYEKELEWLLVSKATVQVYGVLLNTLLEQTIPLSNDIWYWDEVLGSYTFTAIYTIQTSPLRFWDWTKDIYEDSRERFSRLREAPEETLSATAIGTRVTARWKTFYGLVRDSIRERSVTDIQARVLSPLAKSRSEARRKQAGLKRLREMSASGLGVLMDEGLNFDISEDNTGIQSTDGSDWNVVVERSVALMDTVLRNVTALETGVSEFEDIVFASVANDPEVSSRSMGMGELRDKPAKLCKRLQNILGTHIPAHVQAQQHLRSQYGRPNRLVRYWLPATALLLSSTTILRIVVNRKAAILQWIQDLGSTMQDFWMNWIVDPTKKIIKTIRHDEGSEVAIMSRESLKGDRDSLERMVVDFAIDNPQAAGMGGGSLSDAHIAEIRAKVKEGDLTPVLRAYEKDLRRPFVGTVRGDLVRTLLIQVQKTKVDVEVALSGIDALLKSQELVFGFVGLTPGVLVCIGVGRYISGMFGERRGQKYGHRAGQMIRVLRNIDRILTTSTPSPSGILSYKDHGLLLCEVHVLRSRAAKLFPGEVEREFFEDVNELGDISIGIERQLKVVQRIRWAYGKWLSK